MGRLTDKDMWIALFKVLRDERSSTEAHTSLFGPYASAELEARLATDKEIFINGHRTRDVFETHVISKLARPHLITAQDINAIAFAQLSGIDNPDAVSLDRFCGHVATLLDLSSDAETCGDRKFSLGHWTLDDSATYEDLHGCIWEFKNGLRLHLEMETVVLESLVNVNAYFIGKATESAMSLLEDEFGRVATSISKTVRLLASDALRQATILERLGIHEPPVSALIDNREFIGLCLDCYYGDTTLLKESVAGRIAIATQLLIEADSQQNSSIALVLSVGAIDALVVTNNWKVTKQFSERSAIILQPNPALRNSVVTRARHLYDLRSEAIHGNSITADSDFRNQTRRLAAAVLRAIHDWKQSREMKALGTSQVEFDSALNSLSINGPQLNGVNAGLVQLLPDFDLNLTAGWPGRG